MNAFGGTLLVLGLLVLAEWGESSNPARAAEDVSAKQPSVALKKLRPRFTIGKDTTVATGPLDKDGYIDYVAALNQRLVRGATPANNANVLFWKAIGPRPEGALMPPEFFEWLEIVEPPERGNYYIGLLRYWGGLIPNDVLFEQSDRALSQPWTAKEYPHFGRWLKAN